MFSETILCKSLFKRLSLMNKDIEYLNIKLYLRFLFSLFLINQLVVKPRSKLRPVQSPKSPNLIFDFRSRNLCIKDTNTCLTPKRKVSKI